MVLFHLKIFYRQIVILGLASAGALLLLLPSATSNTFGQNGLLYGDVLYPPLVGWVTAGVIFGDRTTELLLTLPRPLWQIYLHRFITLVFVAWVIWLTFYSSIELLATQQNLFWGSQLIGTTVTLFFFAALGGLMSIWRSSHLMGGIFLTTLWSLSILLQEQFLNWPLSNPFLTYQNTNSEVWVINRLLFFMMALIFLFITLKKYQTVRENLLKNIENIS